MKENKHDHKMTKKLKVCCFTIAILFPFILLIPNFLYLSLNPNAKEKETTINYVAETNAVETSSDIQINKIYHYENDDLNNTDMVYCKALYHIDIETTTNTIIKNTKIDILKRQGGFISFIIGNTDFQINTYDSNNSYYASLVYIADKTTISKISWDYIPYSLNGIASNTQYTSKCENIPIESAEIETKTIQESLADATTKIWQNSMLSWTQNTAIKTNINNFVAVFGITNNSVIPNLITYWIILTAIYIVIDIIIELFIYITHIINKEK